MALMKWRKNANEDSAKTRRHGLVGDASEGGWADGEGHDCALHSKWHGFPPQTFKYAKLDPFVNPTAIDRAIKIAENSNAQA